MREKGFFTEDSQIPNGVRVRGGPLAQLIAPARDAARRTKQLALLAGGACSRRPGATA